MSRPRRCRRVEVAPEVVYFKPRGVPLRVLEEISLGHDELEAIRLADLEGLYQEEAAEQMSVSRPTFGRILESAHRKLAEALCHGMAIRIEGGDVEMNMTRTFACFDCDHSWQLPQGTGRPTECPQCHSANIGRADVARGGFGRRRGQGRGMGRSVGRGLGPRG